MSTATLTRRFYKWFGIANLPFLYFNYHCLYVEPLFTNFMFLDTLGNLTIYACCYAGYKSSPLK